MASSDYKVLIVEDDRDIQYLYKLKLEHEGFNVSVASDGKQGLRLAEEIGPHLMLVDLLLPEMNGTDMLTAIRGHAWGSSIRVLVLTNISRDEAPQALRFLHIDRYIVKAHSTPTQIVDAIWDVLGNANAIKDT
jgi:two-component system, OmpR family, response regulator AdeR